MRSLWTKGGLLVIAVVAALATAEIFRSVAPVTGQEPGSALTPAQALAVDGSGATVTVRGVLMNAGANYFTDQRFVIMDPKRPASTLTVQPWLPTEALPSPRPSATQPPVMSDFLDKEVVLTGQIEVRPVPGKAPTRTLIVKRAQLAPG